MKFKFDFKEKLGYISAIILAGLGIIYFFLANKCFQVKDYIVKEKYFAIFVFLSIIILVMILFN